MEPTGTVTSGTPGSRGASPIGWPCGQVVTPTSSVRMRSSRFSEMPCSNEWASSCTSSQGMPKTCTRNASIRRCRVTMRLAELLARRR